MQPCSNLEHFHHPKKKACGHQQSFPIPSASHTHPRQPLIHFLLLWSLFNWTHTLCGLVQRSPFTLHSVFKVHLLCILYQYFGEGNDTPLQYSCLENPMDGGAWKAAVHGVAEGRTRLSNFTFIFHFHALEKEMATHSSVLAWRIPGKGEPGGLPSVGSHRVGHD